MQATGRPATLGFIPTVTGMSIIQEALGVPVAGFGYGRIDLCHTPVEAISVDALVASTVAYSVALARLLAGSDECPELRSERRADSWV
jgi:acetylornithine deacetylase/succinyl-diaminopimelate desuccinylase-like protein